MADAIRKSRPTAIVTIFVREYTSELAKLSTSIDQVEILPDRLGFFEYYRAFRKTKADTAFFPSPKFVQIVAAVLAGVPVRIGTAYRWYSGLFNRRLKVHRKTGLKNERRLNLEMVEAIGIESSDDAKWPNLNHDLVGNDNLAKPNSSYIVFHPGSGGSSHDWPPQQFVKLGVRLASKLDAIVLTGTAKEMDQLIQITEDLKHHNVKAQIASNASLLGLAKLLKSATLVVAGSTGPGHLAAVLGTPSVGLFPLPRALSKERWGFVGRSVMNLSPIPRSGCPDCKDCDCMSRLDVDRVEIAALELLKGQLNLNEN